MLVTSSYHMFRSSLLLRGLLIGSGVEIGCLSVPERSSPDGWNPAWRQVKMAVNEAVKLWGSGAELVWEATTGELLMDRPGYRAVRAWVKRRVLL